MLPNHFSAVAALLRETKLDAMLLTGEANRFYVSGFHSSDGLIFITMHKSTFITDSRYIEAARGTVRDAEIVQIRASERYSTLFSSLIQESGAKRVGIEERVMTVEAHEAFAASARVCLLPAQKLIDGLRSVKNPEELKRIRAAQAITECVFDEMLGILTPDMTEREAAAELVTRMLRHGAERTSFDPIVVAGVNSSRPHGEPSGQKIGRGSFLTMDFGCVSGGYCSDMTRTIAFAPVSEEMRRVYDTVLRAQLAGIEAVRAGVSGCDVDAAARAVIAAAGYGDSFGHSFGHGIGIEVHEQPNASPSCKAPLPAGAVISAEPGIYLPGRFGVRIEDMLAVTETGCENLTRAPKNLIIL